MNCDQHSATSLNIDDRNQLWSKRYCGNKTTTLPSCIGLMKEQRVYFIRLYFGMRWKLLSCWSCKEIRPYLQHLTVWIAQFLDENRNILNSSLWFSSVYYSEFLGYNNALQQRIYDVVVHWSSTIHKLCTPSRIVHLQLAISNGTYPDHDCSITILEASVMISNQSGVSFTKILYTFQSDVERLKRQKVNNCQVCWIIWKPTTSIMAHSWTSFEIRRTLCMENKHPCTITCNV
jgi:hypothetical protein